MWDSINSILKSIRDFVWGTPLMVLILSGGILLTIRMGFYSLENYRLH